VKDDTLFNESFATAVERLGGERWLSVHGSSAAKREYAEFDGRRQQLRSLSQGTRRRLDTLYQQHEAGESDPPTLTASKAAVMQSFRADYARLKQAWGGFAGYDAWVLGANNAAFAAQAAYDELVPGFEALFEREGRNWQRFYDAVKRLAQMPTAERARALKHIPTEYPHG